MISPLHTEDITFDDYDNGVLVDFHFQEVIYDYWSSYFGARYYDPNISIWLSVDPLSDKYPSQSPFSYVGNRPLTVVDPNGMGEYEIDQASGKICRLNDNRYYKDGNGDFQMLGNGESDEGKNMADMITNSKGNKEYFTENSIQESKENNSNVSRWDDADEAEKFYSYAASSSEVEWAAVKFKDNDGTTSGMVGTNGLAGSTSMTSGFEEMFGGNILWGSHSHPGSGGPPSYNVRTINGKGGDVNNAFSSKYNYLREVYDVPNSLIYQYSRGTMVKADETRGAVTWDGQPKKVR